MAREDGVPPHPSFPWVFGHGKKWDVPNLENRQPLEEVTEVLVPIHKGRILAGAGV